MKRFNQMTERQMSKANGGIGQLLGGLWSEVAASTMIVTQQVTSAFGK